MSKIKEYLPNIINFLIILNASTLLIPNKFKAYPIVLLLVASIMLSVFNKEKIQKFPLKKIFFISILFFIYLLSLTYSLAFKEGFSRLSTMSSLVAYPLAFGLLYRNKYQLNKNKINVIFSAFVFSNIIFIIFSFIYFRFQYDTTSDTIIHFSNLINIGLGKFSIHPIYLSIFIGISIIILLLFYNESKKTIVKVYCFTLIVFLLIVIGVLMRKGPILYLIVSIGIMMFNYFKLKKTLLGILIFILITVLTIQFLPKYHNINRFSDLINISDSNDINSSTVIRKNIYICSISLIREKPLIGYGIGNTQDQLDPCYIEKKIDLSKKTYNCHNQFFSILLTVGFIGLFIYIISLFNIFKNFYEDRNFLAISIFTFFILNFLTENVIERENGMILYSFLMSLFIFYPNKNIKA